MYEWKNCLASLDLNLSGYSTLSLGSKIEEFFTHSQENPLKLLHIQILREVHAENTIPNLVRLNQIQTATQHHRNSYFIEILYLEKCIPFMM